MLFANAGIARFAPYAAAPEELFDELFAINVNASYITGIELNVDGGMANL